MSQGKIVYEAWCSMKKRCKHANRIWHNGRGITYDPRWEKYDAFYNDMYDSWFPGATLDRINNDGNYSKENCRWATKTEQSHNSRQAKLSYEKAEEMRKLYSLGRSTYSLARQFGVSQGCAWNVIARKTWRES